MSVGTPTKADYRAWAVAMLSSRPQEAMAAQGYRQRGLVFRRAVNGLQQVARFDLFVRPRYAKDKAQLVLNADISVPEADAVFNDLLAASGIEPQLYTISVPADSLKRTPREPWLFSDQNEALLLEPSVTEALHTEVGQWLDERRTVENLAVLSHHETVKSVKEYGPAPDKRPLYLAALYVTIDRRQSGRKILEFGYPEGSRAREIYQGALDFYDRGP
ncbi:MAG: hypothetical protein ACRDPW_08790 [Mycobacteriales bacterium]